MSVLVGLPKSIIKKYGISKKAWSVYRGGHSKHKKVGSMAKRRVSRRSRFSRRVKRRFHKAKIPLEVMIAGGATIVTPATEGWGSPMQHMTDGAMDLVAQDYAKGLANITLPINGQAFHFDIVGLLNPLDVNSARYTKMLFWSAVASKVRKKLVPQLGQMMKKVPYLGRFVS